MKKLKIELAGHWVLEHRSDDVLPIEILKQYILEEFFDGFEFDNSNHTELVFARKKDDIDKENVLAKLTSFFSKKYELTEIDGIFNVDFYDVKEEIDDMNNVLSSEKNEPQATDDCLKKISTLVACEEFKILAKEIGQISASPLCPFT